jgi:hypothetical protein
VRKHGSWEISGSNDLCPEQHAAGLFHAHVHLAVLIGISAYFPGEARHLLLLEERLRHLLAWHRGPDGRTGSKFVLKQNDIILQIMKL